MVPQNEIYALVRSEEKGEALKEAGFNIRIGDYGDLDSLKEALKGTEDKLILPEACENSEPSWFGFLITCREGVDRNQLVQKIEEKGVQTRMLFAGNLIKHPCFDQMRATGKGYRVAGSLENTDRIMTDTFWIGVYPGMTDAMLDAMADAIKEALE